MGRFTIDYLQGQTAERRIEFANRLWRLALNAIRNNVDISAWQLLSAQNQTFTGNYNADRATIDAGHTALQANTTLDTTAKEKILQTRKRWFWLMQTIGRNEQEYPVVYDGGTF